MKLKHRLIQYFIFATFFLLSTTSLSAQDHGHGYGEDPPILDTLYHYWMKFPADVESECGNSLSIPGMTYRELGCDLLAVSQVDLIFSATPDESCYKIFRTYKVINWCEYDGQAAPVVVSRDWDSWHGINPGICSPLPDGNDKPGDTDMYVIVKREYNDNEPDTVWYDADNNPENTFPDNPDTEEEEEGFWWMVVSGGDDPREESYYEGGCSTWSYDLNQNDSDIRGNIKRDDDDYRYGSFGFWQYTQHISVYDRIDPKLTISAQDTFYTTSNIDCSGIANFALSVSDSCGDQGTRTKIWIDLGNDGSLDEDLTKDWKNGQISGRFAEGSHRLYVEVYDGCGNEIFREKVFHLVDGLAPAPVCQEGLVVELNETDIDTLPAYATIWASDLIASDIYDCNGQDNTQVNANDNPLVNVYSINRVGDTPSQVVKNIDFNCADLDLGMVLVELHAWDEAGNHDFCQTFIAVQDNAGACAPDSTMAMVAAVFTEESQLVEGVAIRLGVEPEMILYTDANGQYEMDGMKIGDRISITPEMDKDPLNGVTAADFNRLRKHLTNTEPFTSPYKRIAADVDHNGYLNLWDLVWVQKMILGHASSWKDNASWRFVAAEYAFPNPADPSVEPIPEVINYQVGNPDYPYSGSFVAVKTGDLNGSAVASASRALEPRSSQHFEVELDDVSLPAGSEVEINVRASDLSALDALQFGLQWPTDELEVTEVLSGVVFEKGIGLFSDQGLLRSMWWNGGTANKDQEVLFRIKVKALRPGLRSTAIQLASSRQMLGEAFRLSGVANPVVLSPVKPVETLMAFPNPFVNQTHILLPEYLYGEAALRIFDQQGRIVLQNRIDANITRKIVITAADLPVAGVYFYEIRQGIDSWKGKMIRE